ncbi:hypothetical protein H8S20_07355 [Clostridium sp. NSJ-6]|uniref:Lipoprotein n=1 Tax=Clostridium hominis TaxID=2763036 RepID=A0ABR7DDB1_9CLOT|nr:hypothetical protein [Clostridium hominis]MBC5628703.1 hypothetical protein [Clostridium hominis]
MKMKKYLALGLSILAIMAMVGCSSNDTPENSSEDNNTSEVNNSQDENKGNEGSEERTYLGKVKKIVGNEIEIELAKDQDVSGNGSKLPEGVQFQESIGGDSGSIPEGSQSLTEGSGEAISQDSISIDPSEGGEVFQLGDPGDNEKLELEYTGETIKITIPTGANIFDMRSGSDSKLSAIKTNSIIKVFAKGTKEAPIVQSVDIVE